MFIGVTLLNGNELSPFSILVFILSPTIVIAPLTAYYTFLTLSEIVFLVRTLL